MKLIHPNYDFEIILEDGAITQLVIESPVIMRKFLVELLAQSFGEDGLFILSTEKGMIKAKDNIEVLLSPFSYEQYPKKLMAQINARFKDFLLSEDNYIRTQSIISELCSYAGEMTDAFDIDIEFGEMEVDGLVKLLAVTPPADHENELEAMLDHMSLMHDILGISSFVVSNLTCFFAPEDIKLFVENCSSYKHNLLLLDSMDIDLQLPTVVRKIIIDKDGCSLF